MQYIGSREEMQRIDAYSIETMGIPGIVLMERAALAMEEEIVRRFPRPVPVTVLAERGTVWPSGGFFLPEGMRCVSMRSAASVTPHHPMRHRRRFFKIWASRFRMVCRRMTRISG